MKTYPINLIDLANRRVLVIGGGNVAARKIGGLIEAGAHVFVISPQVLPEIEAWAKAGRLTWQARPYQSGDLAGAFIVFSATDDGEVNQAAWQEAQSAGCLINVCDDPARSNFIAPAVVRRGEMAITVSTGGASPALARSLRAELEERFGAEYGDFVALLAELRPQLLARFPPGKLRLQAAQRLVHSDVLHVLQNKGYAAAQARAEEVLVEAAAEIL